MLFNDLALFVTVAEELNFSKAAQRFSLPASRVSRRIAELEDHLGVKLFERTTRSVRLTEEGRRLLDRCQMPIESLRELGGVFSEGGKTTLRITAPPLAARTTIGPKLLDFAEDHRDLAIDLITTYDNLDFIRNNIDLAFRVGPITDETLITKPLWPIPYTFCVGEKFFKANNLKKTISRNRLMQLPSILIGQSWHIEGENPIHPQIVEYIFGEVELVVEAVRRNLGIALLPRQMLTEDMIAIEVNGIRSVNRVMNAVYPSRRLLPSRVRQLIDHMTNLGSV